MRLVRFCSLKACRGARCFRVFAAMTLLAEFVAFLLPCSHPPNQPHTHTSHTQATMTTPAPPEAAADYDGRIHVSNYYQANAMPKVRERIDNLPSLPSHMCALLRVLALVLAPTPCMHVIALSLSLATSLRSRRPSLPHPRPTHPSSPPLSTLHTTQGIIEPLFPRKATIFTVTHRHPPVCLKCGALANPFCTVHHRGSASASAWACALCASENPLDPSTTISTAALGPEFTHNEMEYRTPLPVSRTLSLSSMGGHHRTLSSSSFLDQSGGSSTSGSGPPGIVLVIDRNMATRAEAMALVDTLEQTLRDPQLDPATPISLLTFGGTVALARVGRLGGEAHVPFVLENDVLDRAVTAADQHRISRAFAQGEYTAPLYAARDQLILALRNMVEDGSFRFAEEGGDRRARQVDEQDEGEEVRFLSTAIDCLNQCYPKGRRARVLVFITGAPFGPGDEAKVADRTDKVPRSQERRRFFLGLSQGSRRRGLALDIFCLGLAAHLDAACLHTLVSRTGGAVLLYPSAKDPELAMDLYKILFHQALPDPMELPTVEMRVSPHMQIAKVLLPDSGEGEEEEQWEAEEAAAAAATATAATPGGGPRLSSSSRRSSSSSWAPSPALIFQDDAEGEEGGSGGSAASLLKGTLVQVGGWASSLSSLSSWLTNQGPLVAEGVGGFGGGRCGPAASLKEGWARKHAQEQAAGQSLTPPRLPYCQSLRRLTLPRLSPLAGAGGGGAMDLSLLFCPRDTVFGIWGSRPDEFVFQSVLRYVEGGCLVTRVVSEKIHTKITTRNHAPLPVLAVKQAVASILQRMPAGNSSLPAAEARRGVDAVVEEIRTMFPSQHAYVRKRGGYGRPCGTEFQAAMELLYQAHRGPLLGFHQQGEDLAYSLRSRLLTLGLEDASRMIAPVMLSTGPLTTTAAEDEKGVLRRWPCQTMAMWPGVILVLDTQDRIVIWIGREAASMLAAGPTGDESDRAHHSLEACRAYARAARTDRFPTPQLLEVTEGDPLERFLWARVIPTHKDPPDVLLANFPQLRLLSAEQLEAQRVKFASLATDDESLQQYLHRLTPAAVAAQAHYTAAGSAAATHYAHHHPGAAANTST